MIAIAGERERRRGEIDAITFGAWLTGQLAQVCEDYPSLESLLGPQEKAAPQTADEREENFSAWFNLLAAMGCEVEEIVEDETAA